MRASPACASLLVAALATAFVGSVPGAQAQSAQDAPPAPPEPSPSPSPATDPWATLEPAERATLLRLAWQTLVGHLTNHPIQDRDLEQFDLTPRLLALRGCFVTLTKQGEVRGNQGEIDPTRSLYQQVIVFTRRAATRDPRFLPLNERDLGGVAVRVEVIGRRKRIDGPDGISGQDLGVFLEKWGRRALFLPGVAVAAKWGPGRTLEELCRQAALPAEGWKQGARIEVFTTEVIEGPQPPPPPPTPSPAPSAAPPGASGPAGGA